MLNAKELRKQNKKADEEIKEATILSSIEIMHEKSYIGKYQLKFNLQNELTFIDFCPYTFGIGICKEEEEFCEWLMLRLLFVIEHNNLQQIVHILNETVEDYTFNIGSD